MNIEEIKSEWTFFLADGWKVHWCPTSLLSGLMSDAARRNHTFHEATPVKKGFVDLPGMIMTDRTYQEFKLGEFVLSIPTEDMETFLDELEVAKIRKFEDGKEYCKIHGWLHCVVFTPDQRVTMLSEMKARLPAVKIQAKAERAEFSRRIAEINKGGSKVITSKAPDSIPRSPVSGTPNGEKN